ncbi:MAG: SDR family NAD(P)-dependent oxidoreductase [Gemmatimonadales bacterium]|nr:MAG: SDR family NAD(P)-dependent oxidoreductase [Gemmatimonadales bacterium]
MLLLRADGFRYGLWKGELFRIGRSFKEEYMAVLKKVGPLLMTIPILTAAFGLQTWAADSLAAQEPGDAALEPQVALVTGSTGGMGQEIAWRLHELGYHVIVHGRSAERGLALVDEILEAGGSASFHAADFTSLEQVRSLAMTVLAGYDRLDVLVNNAGIGSAEEGMEWTNDGIEPVFQVNYLSHFLLTDLLLPRLRSGEGARIVNVASAAQAPLVFDDEEELWWKEPEEEEGEDPGAELEADPTVVEEEADPWDIPQEEVADDGGARIGLPYARSKLAQILHTFDLAEELQGTGIVVNALHPATFMDTYMVERAGIEPRATVEEGADAVMQLLTEPVESGQYFNQMEPARAHEQAYDREARRELREVSRRLVGLDPQE